MVGRYTTYDHGRSGCPLASRLDQGRARITPPPRRDPVRGAIMRGLIGLGRTLFRPVWRRVPGGPLIALIARRHRLTWPTGVRLLALLRRLRRLRGVALDTHLGDPAPLRALYRDRQILEVDDIPGGGNLVELRD